MSKKTRRSPTDHDPQSPFFPKKDKNYKSRTRKTRNPVTPDKSCHSCLKKFFSKTVPRPYHVPRINFFPKTVPPKICSYVLMSKKPGAAPLITPPHPQSPFFPKKRQELQEQKQEKQEKQKILSLLINPVTPV